MWRPRLLLSGELGARDCILTTTQCYVEVAPQPTVPDARGAHSSTMKLLTHNLLQSPGTRHGYPLAIEAEKVETVETEFNPDFLVRMVEKLDYPGLVTTIATVCHRRCRAAPPRTHAACA